MNINPRSQSIASVLRSEIEAWRRAANISREAVAAMVMDAYALLGGEAATGVDFVFTGDTYTQAKKAAQKLFRWFDAEATLPANMVPSILAALPIDIRLHCPNHILCPLGAEVRSADSESPTGLDVGKHLRAVMKEAAEAQMALLNLPQNASDDELIDLHKELVEAGEACNDAARDAMAKVVSRQALAQARMQVSK